MQGDDGDGGATNKEEIIRIGSIRLRHVNPNLFLSGVSLSLSLACVSRTLTFDKPQSVGGLF